MRGFGVGLRFLRRLGERDLERAGAAVLDAAAAAAPPAPVLDLLLAGCLSRLRLREELELDELLRDELPELEEEELLDPERLLDELLLSLEQKFIQI